MKSGTLLVIEDEPVLAGEMLRHFKRTGWETVHAPDLDSARAILFSGSVEPLVVLCDLNLPDGNGLDLLEEVRGKGAPDAEWIFLSGLGTIPDSVRALRLGAFDFLEKPCPLDRLDLALGGAARSAAAHRRLSDQATARNRQYSADAFLGTSPPARQTRGLLERLSAVPVQTLLIGGETGTGKGLVARILHHSGVRAAGPLVEVNCAALPANLLESELFGHEAGAFTGARARHRGLMEQAHGGTLLLDEVGEMDLRLQAKLLKAVEDRRFRRVGGEREIEVDLQVFAASNRDLRVGVREGRFREDLYHRLSVLSLDLPPLRDRPEDLEALTWAAVAEFNARTGKDVSIVPGSVWARLRAYPWPGNVRELRNVIERCVLLSTTEILPDRWLGLPADVEPPLVGQAGVLPIAVDGRQSLDQIEARVIEEAMRRSGGNVSAAARLLGISRQTLRYRIEKHGLAADDALDEAEEGSLP